MEKSSVRIILWSGILGGLFILSLLLFLFFGNNLVTRTLYFPNETYTSLNGESRKVPRQNGEENNIEVLVNELILGPVDLSLNPLLPKDTTVRSCMLRGKTLYLDFSPELIVGERETRFSLDETLYGVEKTIRFNFPGLDGFVFFIEGENYRPEYENIGL